MKIKETIVVEGKDDAANLKRCLKVETIITSGFGLNAAIHRRLKQAYDNHGLIILTDADSVGERIRQTLQKCYPEAKHAFISRSESEKDGDIGVENASCQAILTALERVRTLVPDTNEFHQADLVRYNLIGTPQAAGRRDRLGAILGIGYGNAKQFLKRLNHYGVTRQELEEAVDELSANQPELD